METRIKNEKLFNFALISLMKDKISIIPVGKDKKPLIPWKEFQTRFATPEEVQGWFQTFDDPQIGFVTGPISNLAVVDVEFGGDWSWLPQNTRIVETGGMGRHFYFKYEEGINNKARIKELCDIRGLGGYVISPNSITEKGPYTILQDVPLLPFPKELFPAAVDTFSLPSKTPPTFTKTIKEYPGYGTGQRNDEMARYIGHILTRIHPSDWDSQGWQIVQLANQRNVPPLASNELKATFESLKRTEKRNNPFGRVQGHRSASGSSLVDTSDDEFNQIIDDNDEIKHIADVAESQKLDSSDIYPLQMPCFDNVINGGVSPGDLVVVAGQSGHGKCLGKGTPIIMFDGSVKKVEEIKTGELLMGPDSKPKRVLGTTVGFDELFRVDQTKGESYVVNKDHILSLKRRQVRYYNRGGSKAPVRHGEITNISIKDYIDKTQTFKRTHKGWKASVEWKNKKIRIDPYFLGAWLGDGTSSDTAITSMDPEIIDYCSSYAKKMGLETRIQHQPNNRSSVYTFHTKRTGGKKNPMRELLRDDNVFENKHIPKNYLINNRKNRLELLAGLIDTDGYVNVPGGYMFINKNERLAKEVCFLAQSLGFYSYCRSFVNKKFNLTYWRVGISGDCSIIPVKIPRKVVKTRKQIKDISITAIDVTAIGKGNYYGFELDGDGLFLLGDFTVTHNTSLVQDWTISLIRGIKKPKSLWFSYEVLPTHLWKKFKEMGMTKEDCAFIPCKHTSGNVAWVEQKIKEGKEKFGIKMVMIDHLGFLLPKTEGVLGKSMASNYAMFLTQVVRDLKTIALREEVIIFLPVHMKKVDSRNKQSDINDIKDSSGIGQESDLVFLIEREKDKGNEAKSYFTNLTKITLAKNRKTGATVIGNFTMINGRFAYDETNDKIDAAFDDFGKEKVEVKPLPPPPVVTQYSDDDDMSDAILNF